MTLNNQQERRALNDGIEDRFLITSDYAAGIRTYYTVKRGVLKDLYEDFHFNFARLIEVTEALEQLGEESEILKEVRNWRDSPPNSQSESEIKRRCDEGLNVFLKYKLKLSARGLLSLPSKGR